MSIELPAVLITLDRETPANSGFRFGTFGKLWAPGGFECDVLQRPPVGEHPYIGLGSWQVAMRDHPLHGKCYEVLDVKGRTAILIHSANWFQQLQGCLAFGRSTQVVEGFFEDEPIKQLGITSSKDAVASFVAHMGGLDFRLTIKGAS